MNIHTCMAMVISIETVMGYLRSIMNAIISYAMILWIITLAIMVLFYMNNWKMLRFLIPMLLFTILWILFGAPPSGRSNNRVNGRAVWISQPPILMLPI